MSQSSYVLKHPDALSSEVVFASPHSGRDYRPHFLGNTDLDVNTLRSSEDAFVDMLFDAAPSAGAPLLCAQSPRAYVDLNRSAEELDPALIRGVPRGVHNPRVASGLGVIPRVVSGGRTIYRGKMDRDVALDRIEAIWRPYHSVLQSLLDHAHEEFGQSILIDCHSMPSEAVASTSRNRRKMVDVVLGDRFGASASDAVVRQIETVFQNAGFEVHRNTPFAGAYVTQHYGRPSRGQHAVQIELNRALYMNEDSITPHDGFADVHRRLQKVTNELARIRAASLTGRLAAE
jgi:N-formylglutamate amidohydrolase